MNQYLFLLTIGPVQEFIAAARRTRDLWAGSQLLSDLSRQAAIYIRDHKGELIFPSPSPGNEDFKQHDVVNRILAIVEVDEVGTVGDGIRHFGKDLEDHIREIFQEKITKVLYEFKDTGFYREIAEQQLNDLLEINWAAVPFNNEKYKEVREQLERILAARKKTRDFKQPSWTQLQVGQPKSSIDGQRESVIPEHYYVQRGDNDAIKKQKLNNLWQKFHISGAERLSGVDLFKRCYMPELAKTKDDFPSTSHIAALPFIWRYVRASSEYKPLNVEDCHNTSKEDDFCQAINEYANVLQDIQSKVKLKEKVVLQSSRFTHFMPYDASILYDSRLREITDSDALKAQDSDESKQAKDALKHAKDALDIFFKTLEIKDSPSPYYAILHADGDAMGQAIDGLASDYKLHQEFSRQLDKFASSVRDIVESHWGALIYSGGDDVLALMPLHSLLSCAKELHSKFDEAWSDFSALGDVPKPTLSIGIAIAHYMEPLSDTLNLARAAEKKAKSFPGKNALAITLSKRSGSDRTIVGGWSSQFYQRINDLIQLYRENTIPDGYAFELEDLWQRLGSAVDPAILRAEAKRIAKRKREGKGSNELLKLAEMLPKNMEEKTTWNIDMFVDELVIASELARALGPIEQKPTSTEQEVQQ
jgi:CRISPR-associated protein Cas10/Cmr2, subtype III-B